VGVCWLGRLRGLDKGGGFLVFWYELGIGNWWLRD
jgi:hypothetical protein